MCGIVGYVGENSASPILIDGLKSLSTEVMTRQALLCQKTAKQTLLRQKAV